MNNTNYTYYDNHTNTAEKQIWLDMDGTFVDLYGVENWLDMLIAGDPTPYMIAKPLVRLQSLARVLNTKRRQGWSINIVSWTSKNGSAHYNEMVANVKRTWLKIHLRSVQFDNIDILPYGTPKGAGRCGTLFDDEERNRIEWTNGQAFDVQDLIQSIRGL